jgi:transcription initiation factor IIF auxiliary subunit
VSPVRVQHEAEYAGDKYWKWSVWLEGPAEELDQISYVQYTLDPTFPNPVRRIADRGSRFKLSAGGWGGFVIYVNVFFRDGRRCTIDYPLRLERPVEEPASP